MSIIAQIKIDRILLSIVSSSVFISGGWWQQSVSANSNNRSLNLQPLRDSDVKIDGANCNFVDRQQRTLLATAEGRQDAWIKIDGRLVKIRSINSNNFSSYRAATLTIAVERDRGVRYTEGITIYRQSQLRMIHNGRKVDIPVTGYCSC